MDGDWGIAKKRFLVLTTRPQDFAAHQKKLWAGLTREKQGPFCPTSDGDDTREFMFKDETIIRM